MEPVSAPAASGRALGRDRFWRAMLCHSLVRRSAGGSDQPELYSRTYGRPNGPLMIDTLPPWLPASPEREPTRTKPTPGAVLPTTDSSSTRFSVEGERVVVDHSDTRLSADRIALAINGLLQAGGSVAFAISGSRTNSDRYSSVTTQEGNNVR